MMFYDAKRTGGKWILGACAFVVMAGCLSSGCAKKEAAPPAVTAPAAQTAPAAPVSGGTSAAGVSPSNTISQKEQAEMAAEKNAGGGK